MNNNMIKVDDNFQEENELSIYDLISILMKHIKLFLIICVLGTLITCLYVGKRIIFDKENVSYINYTLNYLELESYLGKTLYYPKKTPEEILSNDNYLELLFENPKLKALYEEEVKDDREDINNKREFLKENNIIETTSLKKLAKTKEEQDLISPDAYKTTVRVNRKKDGGREVSNSLMETYLSILNQYYNENLFNYLIKRKNYLENTLPVLKKQLEGNAISAKLPVSSGGTLDNNYFKYLYPIEVSNIDTYYEKYKALENEYQSIQTLFNLGLNKPEDFIKYDSSVIIEKEKSGNLLRLGIGLFLTVSIGLLVIFIKEFSKQYNEKKEK